MKGMFGFLVGLMMGVSGFTHIIYLLIIASLLWFGRHPIYIQQSLTRWALLAAVCVVSFLVGMMTMEEIS